eukprot:CAMPEP_0118868648 /NCGR_PEP_ID=MMETSP1163-20130328/12119_1 /TAXON_ID=124430 /ORGANISM="Phaeomonas parva, Strain CCMP2877" /LENGTH=62 /DNA_ID=CAMNT_0006803383 /DNA_START=214 /DNA_END=398 /DNA_ORIENTATION=-
MATREVYVGNLAGPHITQDMLKSIFGCIGNITQVRNGKNGKYAFIEFAEPRSAQMAVGLAGT